MALSYDLDWEIRTTGDNTNGGAYKRTGTGTDYSQQNTAQLALTDINTLIAGDTTINSSTGGFTSAMVGNTINLSSGTNLTTGFYEITGFVSSNAVTLDRAPDNGGGGISGTTGKVGGALAWVLDGVVQYNKVWIKSGTYTLTNTTQGAAGGPIYVNGVATGCNFEGYENTRGDLGTPPVFSVGSLNASSLTPIFYARSGFSGAHIINVKVDGTDKNRNWYGIQIHDYRMVGMYLQAENCHHGFQLNNNKMIFCKASNCGPYGFGSCVPLFSEAHDCTIGFNIYTNEGSHSLAYNCQTGFSLSGGGDLYRCIADSCTQYGIKHDSSYNNSIENVVTNCNYGFYFRGTALSSTKNFLYNNTTDYLYQSSNPANRYVNNDSTSITTSPYVDQANDDYTLNSDATGGQVVQDAWAKSLAGNAVDRFYPDPSGGGGGGGGSIFHPLAQ